MRPLVKRNSAEKFDWPDFLKKVLTIAIPVALQQLLTTTGAMVDTMMLSVVGEHAVGAVGLCSSFYYLGVSSVYGFMGGGSLFIAQYWGAKDEDNMCRYYGIMLTLCMAVSLTFGMLAVCLPEEVIRIYTDKPAVQEMGRTYLQTIGFGYPFMVAVLAVSTMLRATERVRIPLIASIVSVLTNIFLNWVLISGHLGFPALGIQGAALATVIANAVNLTICLILAAAIKYPYLFRFRQMFSYHFSHIKIYFKKCFAILCNEVAMGVSATLINIIYGRQHESVIAAVAVCKVLDGFIIGFFSGFSSAASIVVGKSVGAGELETAYQRAKRLVYLCGAGILMLVTVIFTLRRPLLTIMGLSGESLHIGMMMILVLCIGMYIRMHNWVQNDTFRSAGETNYGTVLEITFMYLLVLPVMYLGSFVFKWPFLLIFACSYIDEPIRLFLMQKRMYSGRWIKPVTPEGQSELPEFRKRHHIEVKV